MRSKPVGPGQPTPARPPTLALPPVDRLRSPYTGWTRAHWEAVADHLLAAVVPYATPGFAQVRLPGRESRAGLVSDGLEGYARTFLLAAFRIAGAGGAAPPGLIERYAEGLANGTDPAHRYAWPVLTDYSQQLVEAASIALALHETRPWLYDRLDPSVQERLLTWLAGMVGRRTPRSNWVLFQVVVDQFLVDAGGPADPTALSAEIAAGLAQIEQWYVGDGWYTDGAGQKFDYYAGWAMHLYPALWARMAGDTERADRYRARLRVFLDQYQHFVAADGAPLHHGRSLCYRFAATAPLWLGALTDATDLPLGRVRRIASGVLRHFVERGVPDERGLLNLGWYTPFLPATQTYSGPGSPYWASKAFVGLLLPAHHPVWTDPEAGAPIDDGDQVLALPGPGWLLHATRHDGVVRVVNHGSDRTPAGPDGRTDPEDPHYARFGYSTHTGPEVGEQARLRAVDGHLAVLGPDGRVSHRRRIERIATVDHFAASAYTDGPDGSGVRVETASVVRGPWELRVHRVVAPAGVAVRDGGYPVAVRDGGYPVAVRDGGNPAATQRAPESEVGDRVARVSRPDGLTSAMVGLYGYAEAGVARAADANAFGPCSATPYLLAPAHPGGAAMYVSLVVLTGDRTDPAALRRSIAVAVDADRVSATFPDGESVELQLGQHRWYRRQPADGGAPIRWAEQR